jgi:feruloyl esterase
MQWSRELKVAGRGLRTALRVASAMMAPPGGRDGVGHDFAPRGAGELITVPEFGANPGDLAMLAYVPSGLRSGAPLVVLLHGCGQDPATFAAEAGWVVLADRVGFALVLPTQSLENNHQGCFNWFRPAHVARGLGEAQSIRTMVTEAARRFGSDSRKVYVAGLSAGGAMTAALLAAYPDVFAAGASIAGLPVGAATGAASALARMAQAGPEGRSAEAWADQVRRSAPVGYGGPWPRLSIWHGGLDTVVDPANAALLALQWRAVHGLSKVAAVTTDQGLARRAVWGEPGRPAVELWTLPTMGHFWPVAAADAPSAAVLPVGVAATDRIAGFWRLT